MSSKRRQDLQITRENEDDANDRDAIDPVRKANSSVLAGRKIAQVRKRRFGLNGSSSIPSSNAPPTSTINPFSSLSNPTTSNNTTNANPFASLSKDSSTPNTTTSNPFALLNSTPAFTMGNSNTVSSTTSSNTAPSTTTTIPSNPLTSTSNSTPPSQNLLITALNENFHEKITELLKSKPSVSWKPTLEKYLEYVQDIESNKVNLDSKPKQSNGFSTTSFSSPISTTSSIPNFTASTGTNTTTNPINPFTSIPPPSSSTPSLQPPATTTTKESASGNTSSSESESEDEAPEIKIQGPKFTVTALPTAKKLPFSFDKPVEKKRSDSDSDSEDDIKIEGPKFTLDKLPTAKSTPFTLKSESTSANPFSFVSGIASKADSTSTEKDSQEKVPQETKPAPFSFTQNISNNTASTGPSFSLPPKISSEPNKPFSFGSASTIKDSVAINDHSWSPEKGIKFSQDTTTSEKEKSSETTKPSLFSFGSSSATSITSAPTTSNPFSFNTSLSSDATTTKPFTFGSSTGTSTSNSSSTPATAPFSFSAPKTDSTPAPTTSNTNSTPAVAPFSFGAPKTDSTPAPFTLNSNATLPFKFSNPSTATPSPTPTPAPDAGAEDGDAMPAEPQTDLSGKGAGEEDETTVYEKKAKVFILEKNEYKVKGLGPLRILFHEGNNKTRIVVRAEGSGRVVLNSLLRKDIEYPIVAKGQVRITDFTADGPVTYMIRVKDAEELHDAIEKHKS